MPFVVGAVVVFAVLYWVIGFISKNIGLTIVVVAAAVALYFFVKSIRNHFKEEKERQEFLESQRREREAEAKALAVRREREAQERAVQRDRQIQRLSTLRQGYMDAEAELEIRLSGAVRALAGGHDEFRDGAFAPFWDAIEDAVNDLARFNQLVDYARETVNEVRNTKLLPTVVAKPLPAIVVPDAVPATRTLNDLVKQAQRDFQFSVIFEQRKTNQILTAGFRSLSDALNEVGSRIDDSVSSLRLDLRDYQYETEKHWSDADEATAEHRERMEEMVDNLQHRRKPD